ncbi:hypothetical protein BV20DRAFT_68780 [Pilatotrama ljubarskyi]|nr:hypothetical protein BV20DRAFT_68780 [Pilatotrama ljubarskyi]
MLNILRDGLGDDRGTAAIATRELALDKALIQLIPHTCKTDHLARALDLARLLHLTPSFDMRSRSPASTLTSAFRRPSRRSRGSVSPTTASRASATAGACASPPTRASLRAREPSRTSGRDRPCTGRA